VSRKASGLKAWVIQRQTAVYLGMFALYLVATLLFAPPADYAAWRDWMTGPLVGVALVLFIFSLLLHAWIGVRDALIDYVHPIAVRATLLGVIALMLVALGLWSIRILMPAQLG
jgi:succinate dehydrogenase / fumarate reductase membrane anchor subunit